MPAATACGSATKNAMATASMHPAATAASTSPAPAGGLRRRRASPARRAASPRAPRMPRPRRRARRALVRSRSCSNCSALKRSASPPSRSDSTSDATPRTRGHRASPVRPLEHGALADAGAMPSRRRTTTANDVGRAHHHALEHGLPADVRTRRQPRACVEQLSRRGVGRRAARRQRRPRLCRWRDAPAAWRCGAWPRRPWRAAATFFS